MSDTPAPKVKRRKVKRRAIKSAQGLTQPHRRLVVRLLLEAISKAKDGRAVKAERELLLTLVR